MFEFHMTNLSRPLRRPHGQIAQVILIFIHLFFLHLVTNLNPNEAMFESRMTNLFRPFRWPHGQIAQVI